MMMMVMVVVVMMMIMVVVVVVVVVMMMIVAAMMMRCIRLFFITRASTRRVPKSRDLSQVSFSLICPDRTLDLVARR